LDKDLASVQKTDDTVATPGLHAHHDDLQTELARLGFLEPSVLAQQPALLNAVCSNAYGHNEVIYRSGEESKLLFIVRSGMLKLATYLPNGRTRIVRLHKRGSLIGLDGLMGEDHEHTAIAINEVEVFQIPHSLFHRWKDEQPHLFNRLMEHWYQYLNYADTWITDFSTGSVKGRVARLLKFLANFESDTEPQIIEMLTTDEMAEILGVTPESVSRVVAEFKRENILQAIENNTESFFTCDLARLENLAQQ
jgi:CRP/FNR family transcriptional regulator